VGADAQAAFEALRAERERSGALMLHSGALQEVRSRVPGPQQPAGRWRHAQPPRGPVLMASCSLGALYVTRRRLWPVL